MHIRKKQGLLFVLLALAGGLLITKVPFDWATTQIDAAAEIDDGSLAATGTFREEADGQDPAHWGKGSLKIYRQANGSLVLQMQEDFSSSVIPAPWIYLNSKTNIDNETDFNRDKNRKKFAKLKKFTGVQSYLIKGRELEEISAVTIWCEAFGAYIASANISPVP